MMHGQKNVKLGLSTLLQGYCHCVFQYVI